MKYVNILGTKYKIIKKTKKEEKRLDNCHGFIDWTSKEIIVEKNIEGNVENIEVYKNKVLRHEIVHGFFMESGLIDYSNDEDLVDWIAIQLPKLLEATKDYI